LVPEYPRKFSKSEKIGAKFVLTTSAILKRDKRKVLAEPFTPYIVDVHSYKNILRPRYRVPQKTVKFVEVVSKMEGSATICAHRNAIKPCNL